MPYKEFEPKDSLEACLTKLWGDPREVNPKTRLEEIILKIANAQPTGPSVPEITAQDEGKVLTVESGETKWSESGGSIFVTTASPIPDDPNDNVILDKTWAELKAAFDANNLAVIKVLNLESDGVTENYMYIISGFFESSDNSVTLTDSNGTEYYADSASDYPETDFSNG